MYKIQSVMFQKDKNTLEDVILYLQKHNFKIQKIRETEHYYRCRQEDPNILKALGYSKYKNKIIDPNKGIIYVIAYKEVSFEEKEKEAPYPLYLYY